MSVFIRACLKTHRASLFHKFWLVFWQNFLQYVEYSGKILPKSRSKFMENRDTLGFKTGSRKMSSFFTLKRPLT
ncbi:MAG: hypothetical protein A3D15_04050 [Alphaproteobacteria bacterium RIFCSPHIGHO2_02_FULL_40_34]|nr:MAG: hypothetical protein A3D15_04050 [Alphaproteobacteria bacterium RIFCSPHIGHO2_02_FULL_40_34]OFX10353.1 MAG: hypothetical protein A3H30_05900 [Alphaproteobacteria bacterium RIFCSPLOWO2_02_FULL_40_19]